jgi:uncharacterized protein (DUF433 family)
MGQARSKPKTLRIPQSLEKDLGDELSLRGQKEWSAGVVEILEEAIRMRKVPGIIFVDSVKGRRAAVAGTGIEVWEIIAMFHELNDNTEDLRKAYDHLRSDQINAALAYYRLYPGEVDARIELDNRITPKWLRENHPDWNFGPGIREGDE